MHPEIWNHIKQLRPNPGRYITNGRETLVRKSTVDRRIAQGRPGKARHERVIPG